MAQSRVQTARPARIVGRYALFDEIASGGMATIHVGRLVGDAGFSRIVAIKKLHPQFAKDPEFRDMFVDEAHLASRIRHPNVVATIDVVADGDDLLLVMEYVPAESLARLQKIVMSRRERLPPRVAAAVAVQVLHGLHAAHEATDDAGVPLGIVHRDVSPQNVLVGEDGVARVLDFGVAKAVGRMHTTREGVIKGKLAYMAPEQLGGKGIDRRGDVYAASVLLWEMLTGMRLFAGGDDGETYGRVLRGATTSPSRAAPGVPRELDAIVMRGLAVEADARFQTARDMAKAIEAATPTATAIEVGDWVTSVAAEVLGGRAERVRRVESGVGGSGVELVAAAQADVATAGTMSLRSDSGARGGRAMIGIAALGVVAFAAGVAWWKWPRAAEVAGGKAEIAVSASASAAASAAAPQSASVSASAPAPAPATATGTGRRRWQPGPAPAGPNCRPPYYFDPDGTKHYKPECI